VASQRRHPLANGLGGAHHAREALTSATTGSLTDPRLRRNERDALKRVALRLEADAPQHPLPPSRPRWSPPPPRPALPPEHQDMLDEVGLCGEGERDRWQPQGRVKSLQS
jgi:hypothetical protein